MTPAAVMRPRENLLTPSNQALQPTGGRKVITWAPPAAEAGR